MMSTEHWFSINDESKAHHTKHFFFLFSGWGSLDFFFCRDFIIDRSISLCLSFFTKLEEEEEIKGRTGSLRETKKNAC
jgi:hypothetical protein